MIWFALCKCSESAWNGRLKCLRNLDFKRFVFGIVFLYIPEKSVFRKTNGMDVAIIQSLYFVLLVDVYQWFPVELNAMLFARLMLLKSLKFGLTFDKKFELSSKP